MIIAPDGDALRFSGRDRHIYARALNAVKEFDIPLDAVAIEYKEAKKLLDGVLLVDGRAVLRSALWNGN